MRRRPKRVLVLGAQVPFVKGGAEFLSEGLVAAINRLAPGVLAELVHLPFKWYPETQLVNDLLAWRLLDISESNGEPIDLIIGTKFPSYAAQHPNKVIWLVHQHRTLYDLEGTQYDAHRDDLVRSKVREIDTSLFGEAKTIKTISANVANRLRQYNGVDAEVLYPPSKYAASIRTGEYGPTILYFGRLETLKRPELLLSAAAKCKSPVPVVIAGDGPMRESLQVLARKLRIEDRCHFAGFLPDAELVAALARARAVFYAPFNEDYGYAAVEAFQAKKPVITCSDAGEVATLVRDTGAGWVVDPSPDAIAECMDRVAAAEPEELQRRCEHGADMAKSVTWERVLSQLVEPYL